MTDRKKRKSVIGEVVSNKMDKSIVVRVDRRFRHPLYRKYINKSSKFMAHDEENECNIGDKVTIVKTRPLSRKKRWRLVEVVEKAR